MSPSPQQRLREVDPVGAGAMGQVSRGVLCSERGVEKPVAIKRLRAELATDPQAVELFVNEARITVRLNHPHLVQGLELGHDHRGYFLVCEWLQGVTAAELVEKGGPLPAASVATIGQALAQGLHWLHNHRDASGADHAILHRDVTPRNVFLTQDGQIKLMDFGVACCKGEPYAPPLHAMGTPEFAPPEQARGHADPRSDVYGLGKTLLALGEPQSPLQPILARATAADPAERFASAEELGAALADAARQLPADPTSLADRVRALVAERQPARLDTAVQSILGGALTAPSAPQPAKVSERPAPRSMRVALAGGIGVALLASLLLLLPRPAPKPPGDVADSAQPARAEPPPPAATPSAQLSTPPPREPPAPAPASRPAARPPVRPRAALVSVNAVPWGTLTINGVSRGNTPLRDLRLTEGEHQLTVTHPPTGLSRSFTIHVQGEHRQTFLLDLQRGTVTRRVLSDTSPSHSAANAP